MTGMKYKTVLWDMDGVLVDSERHWKSLENFFLKDVVNDWHSFDQTRLTGRSMKDIYEILEAGHGISVSFEEYVNQYNNVAKTIYQDQAELMPNAERVLNKLNETGISQGLVSSSSHTWINFTLERFQLRHFFQAVVSSDDVNGVGKPNPAIYEYACEQLKANPSETIVIEDSVPGIQAASGAGCTVIWYTGSEKSSTRTESDYIVHDLGQVLSVLDSSG